MSINIETTGVNHLALRSTDLPRSKRFYAETLGFPLVLDTEGAFVLLAGNTVVGVLAPETDTPGGDHFSSSRVGLDHLALAAASDEEIVRVAAALTVAGVPNTGVKTDAMTGKRYVAFDDPDGIIWELYLA
ncbi:MAG: VOC family protein [Akkermansiaceae bacterium]|nr:VOC family protein [Armatimonadota bacterium]